MNNQTYIQIRYNTVKSNITNVVSTGNEYEHLLDQLPELSASDKSILKDTYSNHAKEFNKASEDEILKFAEYNRKQYQYIMSLIVKNKISKWNQKYFKMFIYNVALIMENK
jgi:hypothetical protein